MTIVDWVPGDNLGLNIPAHSDALRAGGEAFLTKAFHAAGTLAADNRVTRITRFEECPGGSTGRKLLLSVTYEKSEPNLQGDLFVKFSRDFTDEIRDRGKDQLEAEVRFALLSRMPDFPVTVPRCLFADYHHESGTGLLISQRVFFGADGIDPHYDKCLDYELPDALGHYKALIRSLARLAGAHKAGRLPAIVSEMFPFDAEALANADRIRYDARQLQSRVSRIAEFGANFPQLVRPNLREPSFIARLSQEVVQFLEAEKAIKRFLQAKPDFIALCHWNANIDNAWFWRDAHGALACGLMDWGRVGQMNVVCAIWGSLSGGETEMWNRHLDDLLMLFVDEYRAAGGPALSVEDVKLDLMLNVAMLGLSWLMDGPALMLKLIPTLTEIENRFDPRFVANESARSQLLMLTNFLNLWDTQDFGRVLARFRERAAA